jgi:hypothetical protein
MQTTMTTGRLALAEPRQGTLSLHCRGLLSFTHYHTGIEHHFRVDMEKAALILAMELSWPQLF